MKQLNTYILEKLVIDNSSTTNKYSRRYRREIDGIPEDVIKKY